MSYARGCLSPRYNKTDSNSDSRISSNNVAKIHIACMPAHYLGWIFLPPASSQLLYGAVHDRTIIAGHAPTVCGTRTPQTTILTVASNWELRSSRLAVLLRPKKLTPKSKVRHDAVNVQYRSIDLSVNRCWC